MRFLLSDVVFAVVVLCLLLVCLGIVCWGDRLVVFLF